MGIILAAILPIIAFFFESYPRFIVREYGVDVWTHLLYLREYHRQKGIPKEITNGFLIPGRYDYPPAFIFILSKFPLSVVKRFEFLFSPFFDAINMFLIFFLSYSITQNIYFCLTIQLLYLLTPIVVIENSSATPRSLGYTLFNIVIVSLFLFHQTSNVTYLVVSICFGSLIFLSHRFTAQGFLFFSIFFTFLFKDTIFIASFVLSFLLCLVISRGFYLTVLRGHLGNLSFWRKNIKYRFAHQIKGIIQANKTKDFVFRIYNQFLKFPPFVLAITNPWTIPAAASYTFIRQGDYVLSFFWWWIAFAYILALVTIWIPSLRFLGEGQRYFELSTFPTAFLATFFLFSFAHGQLFPLMLLGFIVFGVGSLITIIVIQRKAIIKDTLRTLTPDLKNMFTFIRSLNPKPKLLCIPHQITTNTIYHTGSSVLVNAGYANIDEISDIYPFMRLPVSQVMKKYHLDMVLLNTQYATVKELKLKKPIIVKAFGDFVLLK